MAERKKTVTGWFFLYFPEESGNNSRGDNATENKTAPIP